MSSHSCPKLRPLAPSEAGYDEDGHQEHDRPPMTVGQGAT